MATDVQLRKIRGDDSERLFAWRNSADVAAYMYTDHTISSEEHARWFAGIPGDPRRAYWVIEVDGEPAGLANFYDIDKHHGRASWAYYLAGIDLRGRGIGGFVEFWMIEQAFGPMGLRKLWCEVLAFNEPVIRLHKKFGFQEEARFRQHVMKTRHPQDVVGLGLLGSEWPYQRAAMAERLMKTGFTVPG